MLSGDSLDMKLRSIFSPSIALLSVAASVGVATVFTNAAPASALAGPVTLGFVCDTTGFGAGSPPQIPPSVGTACLTGANQFSAVVSPLGTNQARFTFSNFSSLGNIASSITNIDILDLYPVFSGFSAVQPSNPSVSFGNGTFGGGSFFSIATNTTPTPGQPLGNQIVNGINPLDTFIVDFDIVPGFGKPFNAVATQLLRKGITVQLQAAGFDPVTPSSKILFNSQVKPVPEPITMLGSAAALGFGALMKRRSSKLKTKKGSSSPTPSTRETLA
jgi:hypothetical protein